MDLSTYRKTNRLSQAKFAELMTAAGHPATQALVSQWENGGVLITAERCLQIEAVTNGAVKRFVLRPDIFGQEPSPSRRSEASPKQGDEASAAAVPIQPVGEAA